MHTRVDATLSWFVDIHRGLIAPSWVQACTRLTTTIRPFNVRVGPQLVLLTNAVAVGVKATFVRLLGSRLVQALVLLTVVGGIFWITGRGFLGVKDDRGRPLWYALHQGKQLSAEEIRMMLHST